ncbi:MAG: YbjN domain-containing protein [Kiloniellaceae bacterium]
MVSVADRQRDLPANPLDVLEELVSANDWAFHRHSESELMVEVAGRWCGYHIYVVWDPGMNAMFFSCQLDLRVPETKRTALYQLLASVNENLWLGHFDFVSDDATTMYRCAIPMRGASGLSAEQLEDLVDVAIHECERFYPALQLVVWGGRTVAEAVSVARMDTVGEA